MTSPRMTDPLADIDLAHQTRVAPVTPYENALGDALEEIFQSGAATLEEIVAGLKKSSVEAPDGGAWTEALFLAEMERMGS